MCQREPHGVHDGLANDITDGHVQRQHGRTDLSLRHCQFEPHGHGQFEQCCLTYSHLDSIYSNFDPRANSCYNRVSLVDSIHFWHGLAELEQHCLVYTHLDSIYGNFDPRAISCYDRVSLVDSIHF